MYEVHLGIFSNSEKCYRCYRDTAAAAAITMDAAKYFIPVLIADVYNVAHLPFASASVAYAASGRSVDNAAVEYHGG
mgnify:CR=1 FL=1